MFKWLIIGLLGVLCYVGYLIIAPVPIPKAQRTTETPKQTEDVANNDADKARAESERKAEEERKAAAELASRKMQDAQTKEAEKKARLEEIAKRTRQVELGLLAIDAKPVEVVPGLDDDILRRAAELKKDKDAAKDKVESLKAQIADLEHQVKDAQTELLLARTASEGNKRWVYIDGGSGGPCNAKGEAVGRDKTRRIKYVYDKADTRREDKAAPLQSQLSQCKRQLEEQRSRVDNLNTAYDKLRIEAKANLNSESKALEKEKARLVALNPLPGEQAAKVE